MKTVKFIKQLAAALMIVAIAFAGCEKDDPVKKVSGISLNKSTLTLTAGKSETLVATVVPDDAANKTVIWESSNLYVAPVISTGLVTGITPGRAVVVATTLDGNFKAECTITVQPAPISVIDVTLNETAMTLLVGSTYTLVATVMPDNATDKTVKWSSSNNKVATVSNEGVVTAVAKGTATIIATTSNGGLKAECVFTVKESTITMTTAKEGYMGIALAGTGEAVIDWGDGSAPETVTLSGYKSCSHTFSGTDSRTIAINGQNITELYCDREQLTSLDVTKSTTLLKLYCEENQLTSLDVTKNTALTELYCYNNQLTSLNVKNTRIDQLHCYNNRLTSLDVKNTRIDQLHCYNNRLTSLDVTNSTMLTELHCYNNRLTSLDVTNSNGLRYLYCYENQLTSLNLPTGSMMLTILYCYNNRLTSLDVTNSNRLRYLYCYENQLTSLDVTKNTALTELSCYNNQLTSLDGTNSTELTHLYCYGNQLTAERLNALFRTLNNTWGFKAIYIGGNPGTDGCNRTIATAKGWTVWDYDD